MVSWWTKCEKCGTSTNHNMMLTREDYYVFACSECNTPKQVAAGDEYLFDNSLSAAESAKDSDMMGKRWAVYHTSIPQEWLEANRRPSGGYPHHEPTLDISHQFYGDDRIAFDPQWYEQVATATFNEGYDGELLWRLTNNVDESWSRDFVLPNTFEWGAMKREKPLSIDENGKEWGLRSSMIGDIFHDLDNNEMWIVADFGFEKVHNPENKTFNVEFNEWADQEMNSHGKNISFKDWADDEGLKHGNTEITDWAQHEDESHDARFGAEETDNYGNPMECPSGDKTLVESPHHWFYLKECGNCGIQEDYDEYSAEELKRDSCCCGATKTNPCACMIQGIMKCSATCPCSLEKFGAEVVGIDIMDLKVGQEIKINGSMDGQEIYPNAKLRHHREWDRDGDYFPEYRQGYVDIPIADDGSVSTDAKNSLYYAVKYWMQPDQGDKTEGYFFQVKERLYLQPFPMKIRSAQLRWDKDQDRFFIEGIGESSPDGGYISEDENGKEARAYEERGIYSVTPLEKFGAEEGQPCPTCSSCSHKFHLRDTTIHDEEVWVDVECEKCRLQAGGYADLEMDYEPATLEYNRTALNIVECPNCNQGFTLNAENWGGDPKGKLAVALQKARDKAKEPKKPLKIEKLDAETFNADVKMDDWAWVAYYEYDFENFRPNEDLTKMIPFRDYRKELYGIYLTTKEAKKAFNLLKGGVMGHGDWKDGTIATQVINGWKEIYKGSSMAKTIPVEIKFEYVPIRRFGYDTATHTKIRDAETSGQWEIGEQLEEAQMNAENYRYVKPVPISHSGGGHNYNGYYAIKGYEKPTKDGFTYRILSSPGTKDWYRVYVYDDEKMFQNKSRRLNPSGEMVNSSNPASHLIGSFPRLDDAKRALVFRMIQDEQYYHILSNGNLNWLLYGKNPGSRKWKAESFSAPTKGIDTFTQPFEESSLDSGTVKKVLVGLGIGALALFGYNKWK